MQTNHLYNNLILATYISGIFDVNRNEVLSNNDVSVIKEWADSIVALDLHAVVFHNSLSENSTAPYANNINFIKVHYNEKYNANIFRYFLYNHFIKENGAVLKNIFLTDITDVVVINNPFLQKLFINNPSSIFCGDEPKLLQNDWMKEHAAHLRAKITSYALYEENFKEAPLLNCGIIGGNISVIKPFIEKLCSIHETYNNDNNTLFTGDMGAFNYLIRTNYNENLIHGTPVNTTFKAYEVERKDCWFRHK